MSTVNSTSRCTSDNCDQGTSQCDGGIQLSRTVGYRLRDGFENQSAMSSVVPQFVLARIDDDAVQPAADCRVVSKCGGVAMRGQHRVLEDILGIFGGPAIDACEPAQPSMVPPEQLLEGVSVPGHVGGQQLGVTTVSRGNGAGADHVAHIIGVESRRHFTMMSAGDNRQNTTWCRAG